MQKNTGKWFHWRKAEKMPKKTLRHSKKLFKTPQTLDTVKLRPHVTAHAYITTITADPGSQETAQHQANKGNAKPWQEMPQQATKNAKKHLRHANYYATCS